MTTGRGGKPGDKVILTALPPRFPDGLPPKDQRATVALYERLFF
jgi:hypothetical protein